MNTAFGYGSEQRKRAENQDSFGVFEFENLTLAIVCDGMGGHVGGAQASALAVRSVFNTFDTAEEITNPGELLRRSLEIANQEIHDAARKDHRLMGMGTTAVAAVITEEGFVSIAHVGDSRAYLINDGQAIQITRDHTMVNLFVDAELLTPEDAATHPEAHVLSRSLGVERQVEVDLSDPIELADSDVIFLCSDGVHGVVTDWELGSVDWSEVTSGVQHVTDIVDGRDGDDNATVVAVHIGSGVSLPPTQLPELRSIEQSMAAKPKRTTTLIPGMDEEDEEGEDAADEDSQNTEPSAPPRQISPLAEPPSVEAQAPNSSRSTNDKPAPKSERTPKPPSPRDIANKAKNDAATNKRKLLVIGLGAATLLGGIGLAALVMLKSPEASDSPEPVEVQPPTAPVDPVPETPPPAPPTPVNPLPDPEPAAPVPVVEPVDSLNPDASFFSVSPPEPPRRLPHRALKYTMPPPGGNAQYKAVQAARDHKCSESLHAVQSAMNLSPDYAQLYSQAWFCFGDAHTRALEAASVSSYKDFSELETHFRGWPAPGEPEIEWTDAARAIPSWYRPPLGGIEYRLEAWQRSSDRDLLRDVMVDLQGEPSVADDLATDLWIETEAALALSHGPHTPESIQAWARRVYVVTVALRGRAGALLKTHRPEILPKIQDRLQRALHPSELEQTPDAVLLAYRIGNGGKFEKKVVPKPTHTKKPSLPKEPDLGEPTNSGSGTIIH